MKTVEPNALPSDLPEENSGGGSGPDDQDKMLKFVRRCSKQVLIRRGVQDSCRFEIRRDGNWFILDGWVDSQSTKSELFSLIPQMEDARWIVDRLRIGPPSE